jgi:hypothetical protein
VFWYRLSKLRGAAASLSASSVYLAMISPWRRYSRLRCSSAIWVERESFQRGECRQGGAADHQAQAHDDELHHGAIRHSAVPRHHLGMFANEASLEAVSQSDPRMARAATDVASTQRVR